MLGIVGTNANGAGGLALWDRSTQTDQEGRFVVEGLPAENISFTFLGHGVSDLRNDPLDLDQDNRVVMTAAGAIRGKVVDPSGKPVRASACF